MRTQRGEMEQVDSTKHWPSVRSQAVLAGLLATMACSDSLSSGHNADRPQRWDLNVVVRIGDDNDPSVGLTRVTQVAFGPENNIFIAQSIDRQIRIYDLAGKMLHNIGRSGEGPGEFRSISAMGFVHDTLFVSDGSLRRVSMFEADGSFIQSFPWVSTATPETGSPVFHIPTVPQMVLEDGTALLQQGYGFMPGQAKHLATPWLRIGHDPRIRQDTIAVQEADLPTWGR